MMDRLSLALLGSPVVLRADQPLAHLRSAKAYALFYYLVLTRRAQPRTVLADLFWGEGGEYYARRNLNRTLSNVGQVVGDYLQITRQSLAFVAGEALWCDVDLLERAATLSPTVETIDQLIAATHLYRGDLLDGFQLQDAPAFDHWLAAERQRLRTIVLELLGSIAGYYAEQGDLTTAIDYHRRILQREPWREESHYHLMRLLAQSGQRGAALAQFEVCEQALRIELDVEPAEHTLALVEELRAGTIGAAPEPQRASAALPPVLAPLHERMTPPQNLPSQRTPFVGRTAELVDLTRLLLEEEDCRLLTLIGPGGMGKTRLAIQTAVQLHATPKASQRFADGILFVPLEHVGDLAGMVGAIMAALGAENTSTPQGQRTVAEQLIYDLRTKAMLLLLDNFEHLIPHAHLCSALLAGAPNLKLLVTSRESLALQEAWFYPLLGLTMPTGRTVPEAGQADSDAVRLFAQCARRANPAFDLQAEVAAVVQICTLVEGMPLAIELAAAWRKVMTCAQIAQEVTQGLDFLTARYQNIPARHRSMRAVMAYSWALLTIEERTAIARLAVFRGQFHQAAAHAITGTSLLTLAALVEKALVRVTPAGSYQLHELTRQYAAERVTDDELRTLRDAHARYYAALLEQQRPLLFTPHYRQVWATVGHEFDNIHAAWHWVIDTIGAEIVTDRGMIAPAISPGLSTAPLLRQMAEVLTRYYLAQSLLAAGNALFDRACQQLVAAGWSMPQLGDIAGARQATLVHLQIQSALFQMELGHYGASLALVEQIVDDCRAVGLPEDQCTLLIIYGQTQVRRGARHEATAHLQAALALGETLAPRYAAEALIGLGIVASGEGRYEDARASYQRALALCHEMNYRPWVARLLTNLGTTYSRQANYGQAQAHYTEALALAQEVADQNLVLINTSNLGGVYLGLGNYPLAVEQYQHSLAMARNLGKERWVAANLNGLAQTYLATAALPAAEAALREALTVGQQSDSAPDTLGSIGLFAHLAARHGRPEQALHLLRFVEEHPATMARDRGYNAALLAELCRDLSPERDTAIAAWAAAQTLETVLAEIFDTEARLTSTSKLPH